jgi:hypothetical protein
VIKLERGGGKKTKVGRIEAVEEEIINERYEYQ